MDTLRHVLLAASLSACAHPMLPATPPGEAPPARAPDGVFLDVEAARPAPRAISTSSGSIALTLPLAQEDAEALVRSYFRAFSQGTQAFEPLLASPSSRVEEGMPPQQLAKSLDQRLHAVDYSQLPVDSVVSYDQVSMVPFDLAPARSVKVDVMRPGDVLIDVPVRVQTLGIVRVFGPTVELVVRRAAEDSRVWQIAAVREPDGPWQ